MFLENKYTDTYNRLIDMAKQRVKDDDYYERHHIIPKSMGGADDDDNIVCLTPREHYIAHLLLTKMCEDKNYAIKMSWALHRMVFGSGCSRAYDFNRRKWSNWLKEVFHPERNKNSAYKEKLSESIEASWKNADERRKRSSKIYGGEADRVEEKPWLYGRTKEKIENRGIKSQRGCIKSVGI